MSENKQLFDMASLSEAAYVDQFQNGAAIAATSAVHARLVAAGWSETQVTEFLAHYRVISQQLNMDTGYIAMLFERLGDGGFPTGEYVFAQQRTEPLVKVTSDQQHLPSCVDEAPNNAIKLVADCACFISARGRFDTKKSAANNAPWRIAT